MLDGTSIRLRPLSIRALRKFMNKLDDLTKVKNEDDTMDVLLALSTICLEKVAPELVAEKGDDLDDILDIETVYKIIEVCGGVKLNDPNLVAAARASLNPGGQN